MKENNKKIMDLKYVKPAAVEQLTECRSYFEIRRWLDKYLTDADFDNGLYVFRTDTYEEEHPDFVSLFFVGSTEKKTIWRCIDLNKTAKISEFKNGYFVVSFEDGSKTIVVPSIQSDIITLDYSKEVAEDLDKAYENPLSFMKAEQNDIDSHGVLELFRAIAEWSFYQRQKETEQLFEDLEEKLSNTDDNTL